MEQGIGIAAASTRWFVGATAMLRCNPRLWVQRLVMMLQPVAYLRGGDIGPLEMYFNGADIVPLVGKLIMLLHSRAF